MLPTFGELVEWLRGNWAVLRSAPLPFVLFGVLAGSLSFLLCSWMYGREIDTQRAVLDSRDRDIARYKTALGITEASPSALVELNNKELRAKAISVVARLRRVEKYVDDQTMEVKKLLDAKKMDEKQYWEAYQRIGKEGSERFTRDGLRAEAINVDSELRRRLGPQGVGSIVGVPGQFYNADDKTPIGILSLALGAPTGGGILDVGFIGVFALGIERMADSLPAEK